MIRRLRGVLAGAAVLLVAALVAGGLAVHQTNQAQSNADIASSAERAAEARQLGAVALATDDPPLANLLAVRAVELDNSPDTRSDLTEVLTRRAQLISTSAPVTHPLDRIAVSPDGADIAAYGVRNDLYRIDARSGRTLASKDLDGQDTVETPSLTTSPLAYSHDGRELAVGGRTFSSPALRVFDPSTLRPLPVQPSHLPARSTANDVSWSSDDRLLAATFVQLPRGVTQPGPATSRFRVRTGLGHVQATCLASTDRHPLRPLLRADAAES